MAATKSLTSDERAARRAKYLTGLAWHAGTFAIVNTFFWTLSYLLDRNLGWIWVTLFWGFALAFHALAYLVDGRRMEERAKERFLSGR